MTLFSRITAAAACALALSAPGAKALDFNALSPSEKEAFGAAVRGYLLENPEVILEAVELIEQRQAQDAAARDDALVQANLQELHNDGYSLVDGNPEGDVTLVEFMDYRCGYCRKAYPEIEALLKADGNIRLVVKEYPILGEASLASARFAVATQLVAGDEAYKQVHDALMTFKAEPNEVTLTRLADGLGLDSAAILAQINADEVTERLQRNQALGRALSITGTPTFVLEGEMLRGYLPADQLQIMVDEIREARG